MRARLSALALGLCIALGLVALVLWRLERQHRAREDANVVMAIAEPPGLKYAYRRATRPGRQHGWVHGQPPEPRRPGTRRVLAVGDSITWGMGVEPEQAWPAQLERQIPGIEVPNFGMLGYDAEQVATLLEHHAAGWEPDLVVWASYTNDVAPTYLLSETNLDYMIYVGSTVPAPARRLPEGLSLWLLARSALFRRVQADWMAEALSAQEGRGIEPPPGWHAAQLDRVSSWSRATGIPVLVLAVPDYSIADPARCRAERAEPLCANSEREYRRLTDALDGRGLPWIDGQAAYASAGPVNLAIQGNAHDLAHPNAVGQRALARALVEPVRAILAGAATDTPAALPAAAPPR